MTFAAGGCYLFDMQDAIGQPGTNWDFLFIGGGLNLQASSTNPFVIKLRSIDGNLNDANPGAADFGNASSQSWCLATAAGGLTNFSADKFTVDTSAFANDLDGGSFSVQTNGNSLLLAFFSRPAPPVFESVALDSNHLIFTGAGGASGGNYFVLASTNLTLPLDQWPRIATNSFDLGGGFIFTNQMGSAIPQQFYLLKLY